MPTQEPTTKRETSKDQGHSDRTVGNVRKLGRNCLYIYLLLYELKPTSTEVYFRVRSRERDRTTRQQTPDHDYTFNIYVHTWQSHSLGDKLVGRVHDAWEPAE